MLFKDDLSGPEDRRRWAMSIGKLFARRFSHFRANLFRNAINGGIFGQEEIAIRMRLMYGFTSWRQTTLSKVEAGERQVKLDEAIALCEILGVDLLTIIAPESDEERQMYEQH